MTDVVTITIPANWREYSEFNARCPKCGRVNSLKIQTILNTMRLGGLTDPHKCWGSDCRHKFYVTAQVRKDA
ncbi:hypothetical protein [Bifidobacterium sp. SO1]|uniref:hypothetical protein n=1 Tax=Bifidobacterium sp. SO1 TaxID=2809029 RepID=UPI001BDC0380|nr:hypothetical protein [Bifidobacterium sp. SO1]MBT1162193.1 hypothetical protein [Bifidobacterium sp. SO1]